LLQGLITNCHFFSSDIIVYFYLFHVVPHVQLCNDVFFGDVISIHMSNKKFKLYISYGISMFGNVMFYVVCFSIICYITSHMRMHMLVFNVVVHKWFCTFEIKDLIAHFVIIMVIVKWICFLHWNCYLDHNLIKDYSIS
jgi:hypothetical protein